MWLDKFTAGWQSEGRLKMAAFFMDYGISKMRKREER
jgi:hypothetical protein